MSAPNRPSRGTTLVVTLYESLPDVLARVRSEAGNSVRLEIPTGSPLFLTAVEFRALREVARDRRIDLSLVTDDSLRRQLASVFNLPIEGPGVRPTEHLPHMAGPTTAPSARTITDSPPRTAPGAPPPVPAGERSVRVRNPLPPLPGDPDASRDATSRATPAGRWPGRPQDPDASALPSTITQDDASGRRGAAATVAGRIGREDAAYGSDVTGRRQVTPRVLGFALGGLLIAGLVLFAVGYFLLSSATISVIPVSRPASAALEYAIVPAGTDPPPDVLVIPGEQLSLEFEVEASQPTTGTRAEAAEAARGRVRFSNPSDEDIEIAADTPLTTDDGRAYLVAEAVTVPAGDPGLGRYGSAEASVTAQGPGTVGNLDTGELSGRLENGVYYSNRDAPIADGTDRQVPIVAAEDVQALRERATVALREKIAAEVMDKAPDDVSIVQETIAEDDLAFSFSGQAGDDAEMLSVTVSAPVTVLTYRPADADTAIRNEAVARLTGSAPAGFQLDPDSVQLSDPDQLSADAGSARYAVTGSGVWVAVIPDAERDRLANELAGSGTGEVDRILAEVPSIEGYEVDYAPGWLPDRMPPSASRIEIRVDD